MMLHLRIFLMLLAISTAVTIFTASMVSSSMGLSMGRFFPTFCKSNPTSYTNSTILEDTDMSKIDYSDVDFLSYELEHQIIQLLGDNKDSVHNMEDIYPGRDNLKKSYDKYMQDGKRSPYLRYKHCKNKSLFPILFPFSSN